MAEAILTDIAGGLISKLGSSVLKEIGLWWGLKNELEGLKETVSTIQAVLRDAEDKSMDEPVKIWLGMLSEAMYEADDLLDDFSTEALHQQVMGGSKTAKKVRVFFSSSNQFAFGLKMAHKIKAMRERLEKIAANRKFHLEERSVEKVSVATGWRQTHSSPPQVVIGRDADKAAILKSLLSPDYQEIENVSVLTIVGIGGLGKTTLAQLVYNDDIVQKHFQLKMWVCVSDDFDVKLLVKKFIESATGETPNVTEMDPLKSRLHEKINGRKYLLVLDDVWNTDKAKWDALKDLLVGGARGSKIVLTTRLREAAEISQPIYIHELRGLSEDEAWSLFKQMAFKQGQVVNQRHEAIGSEIVVKCCGVPLAIRAIGGMLYSKHSESEWLLFKDEELSKVDVYKTGILPILKLSYNHLPSHYKHCVAYCSLYPKDYEICVEELIYFWKAQGYIKPTDTNNCLQDVGFGYFMHLFRLSFFQDAEKDYYDNITKCKMHDLMHDLVVSVAGDNFSSSDFGITNTNERTKHISFRVDRNSASQVISSSLKAKRIRTILPIVGYVVLINQEELDGVFCNFSRLRVLNLSPFNFCKLPNSIYNLKHLRHLDLSNNEAIRKLPNSITNLRNLQVLILKGCSSLEQLPDNITKLVNLTDLDNDGCKQLTHMPRDIGKMTQLEKLSLFVIAKDSSISKHSGGLHELHALNKLRGSLEISNLEWVKDPAVDFEAANSKVKQLQKLTLKWNYEYGDECDDRNNNCSESDEKGLEALRPNQSLKQLNINYYRGERPPSWLPLLTNLVSIEFWYCESIEWLPPLDQLPYLSKLAVLFLSKVKHIEVVGNYENRLSSSSFFPSLTLLQLSDCPNLKGFVGTKPSSSSSSISMEDLPCFPCLSRLEFCRCPNLTSMPLIPELKELVISGVNEIISLMKRATTSASESSSSPFSTLSQLVDLEISGDLKDCEVDELLPYLPSLQSLRFWSWPCKSVSSDEKDDGMQWQSLKVLRSVEFLNMENLVSLPKGLQYVITLQHLCIFGCASLASIPEWMGNLISLQDLTIDKCPQLSERCKNNTAEDWPNISHIPNILVDREYIQRNGCYQL